MICLLLPSLTTVFYTGLLIFTVRQRRSVLNHLLAQSFTWLLHHILRKKAGRCITCYYWPGIIRVIITCLSWFPGDGWRVFIINHGLIKSFCISTEKDCWGFRPVSRARYPGLF